MFELNLSNFLKNDIFVRVKLYFSFLIKKYYFLENNFKKIELIWISSLDLGKKCLIVIIIIFYII